MNTSPYHQLPQTYSIEEHPSLHTHDDYKLFHKKKRFHLLGSNYGHLITHSRITPTSESDSFVWFCLCQQTSSHRPAESQPTEE